MTKFNIRRLALRAKQKGLTTVEYAVAGGIIVAAVITGFNLLGTNIGTVINNIAVAIGAIPAP